MGKWYLIDNERYNIDVIEISNGSEYSDRENAILTLLETWNRYKTPQERRRYIDSRADGDGEYILAVSLGSYDNELEELNMETITDHIDIFEALERDGIRC